MMKTKRTLTAVGRFLLPLIFWAAVWWLISWRIGKPLLLPSPGRVMKTLGDLLQTRAFYQVTARSIWNVVRGILYAILAGVLLAFLTYRVRLIRDLLFPLMTVVKATPVASFIVLAIIWVGNLRVPTLITVLIVLPVVWSNLDEGLRKQDETLLEVARVYRFSYWRRLRVLTLPSLRSYFFSALRTSLGLAWKAGIAAEIIANVNVGEQIKEANLYFQVPELYAWTLTVILLSLVLELVVMGLLRKFTGEEKEEKG